MPIDIHRYRFSSSSWITFGILCFLKICHFCLSYLSYLLLFLILVIWLYSLHFLIILASFVNFADQRTNFGFIGFSLLLYYSLSHLFMLFLNDFLPFACFRYSFLSFFQFFLNRKISYWYKILLLFKTDVHSYKFAC